MKNSNTRHIEVKTLLNSDEYVAFATACGKDVKHSPLIRGLIRDWLHRNQAGRKKEWPAAGQHRPRFPGRRGAVHMPLRV